MLLQILFFSVTLTAAQNTQPTKKEIKVMYNDGEGGCDSDGVMPVCGTGTEWDGPSSSCVSNSDGLMSACGTGTELVGTKCVPSGSACGTGTAWDGMACVSENSCITPTHSLEYIASNAYTALIDQYETDDALDALDLAHDAYTAYKEDFNPNLPPHISDIVLDTVTIAQLSDVATAAAINTAYATLNSVYTHQEQLIDAAYGAEALYADLSWSATNYRDSLDMTVQADIDEHYAASAVANDAAADAAAASIAYTAVIDASYIANEAAYEAAKTFYVAANLCI